jgi:hypothetical protein
VKMLLSEMLAREMAAFSNSVQEMACCMTVEVASLAAIRNAESLAGTIAGEGVSGAEVAKH